MATVDVAALRALVAQRYLTVQQHPAADLLIWNYTPKTQFERYWTPETRMCRGLITTSAGDVVARPFEKFFGVEELTGGLGATLPDEPFEAYEKLDGSLGILYHVEGSPYLATRGSFAGVQAARGSKILRRRYGHVRFRTDVTYLFEIVYPENRIVVDYGDREDVVLLAAVDTETGVDLRLPDLGIPTARRIEGCGTVDALRALRLDNQEGFVVRFRSGLRVKVKLAEYVRLHRLVTGVTPRHIWECLRAGQAFDDLLCRVPDGFAAWVRRTAAGIQATYVAVEQECRADFRDFGDLGDRRATAAYFKTKRYPLILFKMLDGKPYADEIWKLVRPDATEPFQSDES
jgi:RNA ligase